MSEHWFTSDTHFGHVRIAEFCPQRQEMFGMDGPGDIATMNEGMIEVWNNTVSPGDKVWHLGDFAMGKITDTLPIVAQLNGDITLVLGNHDRPHPAYTRDETKRNEWFDKYMDAGFWNITMGGIQAFGEHRVLICHFPYSGDTEGEDRYTEHRPADDGRVVLHGHVHDMWRVNKRQINVGFDAWGRILHADEIPGLIRQALS